MKKFLLWAFIIIVVAVGGLLGVASMRPDTFHVERSANIAAPPEKIVALVSDFKEWGKWSPWEKLDPAMTRTMSDPSGGVGATYSWKGNSDVGEGKMDVASVAPDKVVINIHFIAPIEGKNVATFAVTPDGTGTKIVWSMDGPAPLVARVMDMLFGFDAMIGPDFEKGLNQLKAEAEKA